MPHLLQLFNTTPKVQTNARKYKTKIRHNYWKGLGRDQHCVQKSREYVLLYN